MSVTQREKATSEINASNRAIQSDLSSKRRVYSYYISRGRFKVLINIGTADKPVSFFFGKVSSSNKTKEHAKDERVPSARNKFNHGSANDIVD